LESKEGSNSIREFSFIICQDESDHKWNLIGYTNHIYHDVANIIPYKLTQSWLGDQLDNYTSPVPVLKNISCCGDDTWIELNNGLPSDGIYKPIQSPCPNLALTLKTRLEYGSRINNQYYRNNEWAITIKESDYEQYFIVAKFAECHETVPSSITAKGSIHSQPSFKKSCFLDQNNLGDFIVIHNASSYSNIQLNATCVENIQPVNYALPYSLSIPVAFFVFIVRFA